MWGRLKSSVMADMKIISHDVMLLLLSLSPFLLIILLRLIFPIISRIIFTRSGFLIDRYYSLTAITFVSIIPMLFGMVYAFIHLDENDLSVNPEQKEKPANRINLNLRIIVPIALSFIMVLLSILIANPVSTEGWLRTIFVTFLLSIQSAFVFFLICSLAENRTEGSALSKIYAIFLITVPLGLLLHHPWNYLAFFSPLYWISWAWVIPNPAESFIYGVIAFILTSGSILMLLRQFIRRFII